jgi:hypothetical protein
VVEHATEIDTVAVERVAVAVASAAVITSVEAE